MMITIDAREHITSCVLVESVCVLYLYYKYKHTHKSGSSLKLKTKVVVVVGNFLLCLYSCSFRVQTMTMATISCTVPQIPPKGDMNIKKKGIKLNVNRRYLRQDVVVVVWEKKKKKRGKKKKKKKMCRN